MKTHIATFHEKFECADCQKIFSVKSDFDDHLKSVHDGEKPLWCEICKTRFTLDIYLQQHMKRKHASKKKKFKCNICSQRFRLEEYLKQHMIRVHEPGNNQPYQSGDGKCVKDLKFTVKNLTSTVKNLTSTVKIFSSSLEKKAQKPQEKPFACSICDKKFATSYFLKDHVLNEHKEDKVPNTCSICNLVFWTKNDLASRISAMTQHINVAHKGTSTKNVAKEIWVTGNDMDEESENLDVDAVIEKESIEDFNDKNPVETYDFVQN